MCELLLVFTYACPHISIGEGRAKRQARKSGHLTAGNQSIFFSFFISYNSFVCLFYFVLNFLFIYSSLIQYIPTTAFPSSILPSTPTSPLTQIHTPPPEKSRFPRSTAGSSKTRHKHSYQGWARQPSGRKGSQEQGKESEIAPIPRSGVPAPKKRSSQQP